MSLTGGKLVRDLIPQIIEANGDTARTHILDFEEYVHALKDKFFEEVAEFFAEVDKCLPCPSEPGTASDAMHEELADIQEVVDAYTKATNDTSLAYFVDLIAYTPYLDPNKVNDLQIEKRQKRGGFSQRIFLFSE